jgi:DNA-binding HxlR family transcriptional regulator
MNTLQIHKPNFITYTDTIFIIDVLGGVDLLQIEKMICTLRITHGNYPPLRYTLDLYNDNQIDKLIRTLCDKWSITLFDVSKSVHAFVCRLESYKLERLRYPQGKETDFEMNAEEEQAAKKYLTDKNLIANLQKDLRQIGILGEDENALILFLAMASHKSDNPFSVLCLAKSGIGKSYLLQKLSECMPKNSYSFHTQISENALYYFDSRQIDGKTLFIEDLEWTDQMLMPLATLQTQGKIIKTRATKNKDGMLHSTTFEVSGKLCLIDCAYSEKNYEHLSLPFLCLHLNHSQTQDINVMEYQKKCKAGLINQAEIAQTQRRLQCVIASLKRTHIINPFAPHIHLPDELPYPRKTLLLLLNFIDAVTFFHQYQREAAANTATGDSSATLTNRVIKTRLEDIELAFELLKNSLLRRADELSNSARGFYNRLKQYLTEAQTNRFTALDIRKAKRIHPRTLNRHLQELALFNYIQITGGNKYREGYRYKITGLDDTGNRNTSIETALKQILETIKKEENSRTVSQTPLSNSQTRMAVGKNSRTTQKQKIEN